MITTTRLVLVWEGIILRKHQLWVVGLVVFLLCCGLFFWLRVPVQSANLLLITLDTTRADRLGCYGHQTAITPVLNQLAKRGVLFERAYCPVPLTLPSHASMLTGLYPPEHGLHNNGQGALPTGLPTLATELQTAGYEAGAFVAAVVLEKKFGLARGFGTYDDDLSQADEDLDGHHRYRAANYVVDAALNWIRPRATKKFFCWVHLFDPHYPYLTHAEHFGNKFEDRPYDAEIAYVDTEIGRLIVALRNLGVLDQTTVVIVGDHGESLEEHGERTHSMTVYDATLRVPLLISVPGISCPGHRVTEPVSLVDLCPTVLDCLGLKPFSSVSGRSLRPALQGEMMPTRACYAETDEPYQTAHWAPLRALVTSQWKYIRSPKAELYDLRQDPHELRNLAMQQPERLQELEKQLAEWEQRMRQNSAENVALSDQERRALSSLGYAARSQTPHGDDRPLPDVKDMLPYYNMLNDANAMMEAGQYDEAEPLLRQILAADDQYFMAYGDLGKCLMRQQKTAEAIVHLRRNVELDPGADRVRANLGAALLQNGDFREAVDELEITLRLNPDIYQARYNLGMAFEKLQRIEDAIKQYQLCLKLVPDFAPARQRLQSLQRNVE